MKANCLGCKTFIQFTADDLDRMPRAGGEALITFEPFIDRIQDLPGAGLEFDAGLFDVVLARVASGWRAAVDLQRGEDLDPLVAFVNLYRETIAAFRPFGAARIALSPRRRQVARHQPATTPDCGARE